MSTLDIPPTNRLDVPTNAEVIGLQHFGVDLDDGAYYNALDELDGKTVIIDTTSYFFFSPLFETGRLGFSVRFAQAPLTIRGLETHVRGASKNILRDPLSKEVIKPKSHHQKVLANESLYFEYDCPRLGLDKPVVAIAPLDRAITTIYLPN